MEDIFKFLTIENFAMFIAMILLFRTNKAIDNFTKALEGHTQKIAEVLAELCNRVSRIEIYLDLVEKLKERLKTKE